MSTTATTVAKTLKSSSPLKRLAISKEDSGSEIDLVIAIDATASMGPVIDTVKKTVEDILKKIAAFPHCASLRYSLIGYRDHDEGQPYKNDNDYKSDWVIQHTVPFTQNINDMLEGVKSLSPKGGGDLPEAVTDALATLLRMDWRKDAAKCVILIGDAPPHGVGYLSDKHPNGCPCGESWQEQVSSLRENGIVLHTVALSYKDPKYAEPFEAPIKEFHYIAKQTRGHFFHIKDCGKELPGLITGVADRELEQIRVSRQVLRVMQEKSLCERLLALKNEDHRAAALFTELRQREVQVGSLNLQTGELEGRDLSMVDLAGSIATLRRMNAWDGRVSNEMFPTWNGPLVGDRASGLFAVPADFALSTDDDNEEMIPLTSVDVKVAIQQGSACEVTVVQTYVNTSRKNIDASYKFPIDSIATVTGFVAEIGDRKIYAECMKKEEARAVYEEASKRGDGAFLLEQQNRETFEMKLGNLLPDQKVVIKLTYMQLLEPVVSKSAANIHRLLLPTTIAPPYIPKRAKNDLQSIAKIEDSHVASPESYSLTLSLDIEMLQPLLSIECPSHAIQTTINPKDNKRATVTLGGKTTALDRDFLIHFSTEQPAAAVRSGSSYVQEQWPTNKDFNWVGVMASFTPILDETTKKWVIRSSSTPNHAPLISATTAVSLTAVSPSSPPVSALATTAVSPASPLTSASATTAASLVLASTAPNSDGIDRKTTEERANLQLRILCDVSNSLTGDAATRVLEAMEYIQTKRRYPSDASVAMYEFGSDARCIYSTDAKPTVTTRPIAPFLGFETDEDKTKTSLFPKKSAGGGTQLLRLLKSLTTDATNDRPISIMLVSDGEFSQFNEILKLLSDRKQAVELYVIGVGYTMQHANLRQLVRAVSTGAIEFCHPSESIVDKIDRHIERMSLGLRQFSMTWGEEVTNEHHEVENSNRLTSSASRSCILSGEDVLTFALLKPGQKTTLTVRAISWTGKKYLWDMRIDTTNKDIRYGHLLPRLAGRAVIQDWEDSDVSSKESSQSRIIDMAVTLNLSSTGTSFVAVDERENGQKQLIEDALRMKKLVRVPQQATAVQHVFVGCASTTAAMAPPIDVKRITYEEDNEPKPKHIAALQLGSYAESQLAQHSVSGVLAKVTHEQWITGVFVSFEATVSRVFFDTFATTLHGKAGGLNVLVNAVQRLLEVHLIDKSKARDEKRDNPTEGQVLIKVGNDGKFAITITENKTIGKILKNVKHEQWTKGVLILFEDAVSKVSFETLATTLREVVGLHVDAFDNAVRRRSLLVQLIDKFKARDEEGDNYTEGYVVINVGNDEGFAIETTENKIVINKHLAELFAKLRRIAPAAVTRTAATAMLPPVPATTATAVTGTATSTAAATTAVLPPAPDVVPPAIKVSPDLVPPTAEPAPPTAVPSDPSAVPADPNKVNKVLTWKALMTPPSSTTVATTATAAAPTVATGAPEATDPAAAKRLTA